MSLSNNFRMLAIYNQRMNKQLIEVCRHLTPEQLNQETHSFFSDVMSYWNHILFGDLIMLRRLVNNGLVSVEKNLLDQLPVAKSVNDKFVNDIDSLSVLRNTVDNVFIEITEKLSDEDCNNVVKYTTTNGEQLEKNVGEFFQHIFNHQTHHRGQLTCILSQFGLDFGCTDLPIIMMNNE